MDKEYLNYSEESQNNKRIKKIKMQCNGCGYIGYEINCPNNDGTMHRYKKSI